MLQYERWMDWENESVKTEKDNEEQRNTKF